jgi:hypothetical protein
VLHSLYIDLTTHVRNSQYHGDLLSIADRVFETAPLVIDMHDNVPEDAVVNACPELSRESEER